jgi:predicted MFS family arabinose efflux permease
MLLLGLFIGVWVDRGARLPVMIWSNFLRACVLALVPVLWWMGWLSLAALVAIAVVHGALGAVFIIAYPSYLPALVPPTELGRGNARLQVTEAVSNIAGPSLAGLLVQAMGGALVIGMDALSFVFSAAVLRGIRAAEPKPDARANTSVVSSIRLGLAFVLQRPALRVVMIAGIMANISGGITHANWVLFATRELNIPPAMLGLVMACLGPGALCGALFANRLATALGHGRATLGGIGLCIAALVIPTMLYSNDVASLVMAGLGYFVFGLGGTIWSINVVTLRQRITPVHLLGRVNASVRTFVLGALPVGALLGGWMGELLGLRSALVLAAVAAGLILPATFAGFWRADRDVESQCNVHAV